MKKQQTIKNENVHKTNKRIFCVAGHGGPDPGVIGVNGRREADEAFVLAEACKEELVLRGFTVWRDPKGWNTSTAAKYLREVMTQDDCLIDWHFNAFDKKASGIEVIYPADVDKNTPKEKKLAEAISDAGSKIMDIPNRGAKTEAYSYRKRLAMMRPAGINLLIETCFLDNENDVQKFDKTWKQFVVAVADILSDEL